jgi:energy-coupling factor transporter ATP-binding protein EcfA2
MLTSLSELAHPAVDPTAALHPRAPISVHDTGLSGDLIAQLLLKQLHRSADCTGIELGRRAGLEFSVIEPLLENMRRLHHCEIAGGGMLGGPSYRYRITDAGRRQAHLLLEHSQYSGFAPVPLSQYRGYMESYRRSVDRKITPDGVRRAVSHLVLTDKVLHQIGPAVASGQSMFVYGPPGNGKTVIARALHNLLPGEIAIPHALEVEGQIVRLFDPINHEPVTVKAHDDLTSGIARLDQRWVRCRRPNVMVGGELALSSLDLAFSPLTGLCNAPIQLMANGGVLVIDDFGRQHCSPTDLLNRWIVPLESRIDFLTLQSGQKFEVPFMVLIVFATNINPSKLVDEAFLRRIQFKILAENPTRPGFKQIFEKVCRENDLEYDDALVEHLLSTFYEPRGIKMRGCQPRDVIGRAMSHAAYMGYPHKLTNELLETACESYFVNDGEDSMAAE